MVKTLLFSDWIGETNVGKLGEIKKVKQGFSEMFHQKDKCKTLKYIKMFLNGYVHTSRNNLQGKFRPEKMHS